MASHLEICSWTSHRPVFELPSLSRPPSPLPRKHASTLLVGGHCPAHLDQAPPHLNIPRRRSFHHSYLSTTTTTIRRGQLRILRQPVPKWAIDNQDPELQAVYERELGNLESGIPVFHGRHHGTAGCGGSKSHRARYGYAGRSILNVVDNGDKICKLT